jgi:hypothetical protein
VLRLAGRNKWKVSSLKCRREEKLAERLPKRRRVPEHEEGNAGRLKKRDDVNDVIREESSRGRKRPIDTDAIRAQSERNAAVLQIFRRGTRDELRALLKTWGFSKSEIETALKAYDAALEQQSF